MPTSIALFRGINVGGRNPLPMEELRTIFEHLGCRNVQTYIQSGNVVFDSPVGRTASLSRKIAAEIKKRCGFEPHVLLLTRNELEEAIRGNPYTDAEADPKSLHLGFLAAAPTNPDLEALKALKRDSERFHLGDRVFYLHAPEGVGRSRLAAGAEKRLGVSMTDRNWKTVYRIRELANQSK